MNITKRVILSIAILISIIFMILYFGDLKYTICGDSRVLCWRKFNLGIILSLLGPALLVPSLISLKVSEAAFKVWKKITLFFIPMYLLIIILMPWSVGDEFAGFTKGAFGLFLCMVYVIFSVIYLLVKKNKV